jgi:hypothetical protein
MAIIATVDKFGMTFSEAYHKITRLTYESTDMQNYNYPTPAPVAITEGSEVPPAPIATQPEVVWVKKNNCYFEVATYATEETRAAHAEPIYRSNFNFEPAMDAEAEDILIQAYNFLKSQAGYEDAEDC